MTLKSRPHSRRYHIRGLLGPAALAFADELATAKKNAQALAKTTGRDYEVVDTESVPFQIVYRAEGRLWKIGACSLALLAVFAFAPVAAWAEPWVLWLYYRPEISGRLIPTPVIGPTNAFESKTECEDAIPVYQQRDKDKGWVFNSYRCWPANVDPRPKEKGGS